MRLILGRHGNTFSPGEKAVWVGARTDLPLVEEGCRQAARLGEALRGAGVKLSGLYCGPLSRTSRHAEIVSAEIGGTASVVEKALTEIDYGYWEGLDNQEIASRFGKDELHGWETQSIWPSAAGWRPSEQEVADAVRSFVQRLQQAHGPGDTVLAITSNGILRYFLRLDPEAFRRQCQTSGAKVATGRMCLMDVKSEARRVLAWNIAPEIHAFA
jgi:probable phosphoglycerate mutase